MRYFCSHWCVKRKRKTCIEGKAFVLKYYEYCHPSMDQADYRQEGYLLSTKAVGRNAEPAYNSLKRLKMLICTR